MSLNADVSESLQYHIKDRTRSESYVCSCEKYQNSENSTCIYLVSIPESHRVTLLSSTSNYERSGIFIVSTSVAVPQDFRDNLTLNGRCSHGMLRVDGIFHYHLATGSDGLSNCRETSK